MKYLAVGLFFLIVVCIYQNFRISVLEEKNSSLRSENEALIINNERLVKNEMEVRKQKAEIKKAVEADKSNFDWHYNLSNNSVRKLVSDNCLSCKN